MMRYIYKGWSTKYSIGGDELAKKPVSSTIQSYDENHLNRPRTGKCAGALIEMVREPGMDNHCHFQISDKSDTGLATKGTIIQPL